MKYLQNQLLSTELNNNFYSSVNNLHRALYSLMRNNTSTDIRIRTKDIMSSLSSIVATVEQPLEQQLELSSLGN